jgi:hypothetical protein
MEKPAYQKQLRNHALPESLPEAPSSEIDEFVIYPSSWGKILTERTQNFFTVMKQKSNPVSPIDQLRWLDANWDGCRAKKPSELIIARATDVWNESKSITGDDLPRVKATPDGFVAFSWSDHYPKKELQVSIYDTPKFSSRWVLSGAIGNACGFCDTRESLANVIASYQKFESNGP